MDASIRISVCMASYNGSNYIVEQINSILSQLGPNDELIVTDDKSSDDTIELVKSIGDNRIRLFQNPKNLGYTRNFERALSLAEGKYIFLADQDDVWLPGKVDAVLKALQDYDMVVTDATVVDANLNVIEQSHFQSHDVKQGFWINFIRTRYIGACMAFRKKVLELALPFPLEYKKAQHDYWITLIAEKNFKVGLIRNPYLLYRRHGANASSGGIGNNTPISWRLQRRWYCLKELMKRINGG